MRDRPGTIEDTCAISQLKGAIVGIGTSILLAAVGAILRFAVSLYSKIGGVSVNWHVVGDILMIVGAIGLVVSLMWSSIWARSGARTTVSDESVPVRRERVVDDLYEAP